MRKPSGYWDKFINLKRELRAFVKEHGLEEGKMPGTAQMKDAGRVDILTGIRSHGGMRTVAAKLGWQVFETAKPSGYWQDFTNLARELQAFIEEHDLSANTLPATTQLRAAGRHDLVHAIEEYWSMREVAAKLDWRMANRDKPLGYWNEFGNLEQELLSYITAHGKKGKMPAYMELEKAGRMDLVRAIEKHGGFAEVATRLGLKRKIHVDAYWQDFANLARELQAFVKGRDLPSKQLPARWQLRAVGREDILRAIDYHGTARAVAAKLGWRVVNTVKAPGYWEDFGQVERELLAFIAEHGQEGVMPMTTQLEALGQHGLLKAIAKHGGVAGVASRLGLERTQTTKNTPTWQAFADMKSEIQAFIAAHGEAGVMPTAAQFEAMGRADIVRAIDQHGGSSVVALLMGLREAKAAPSRWRDFGDLKRELIAFTDEHHLPVWQMPSNEQLRAEGRDDLVAAIAYHGLASEVARRLGWKAAPEEAQQRSESRRRPAR